MRGENLVDCRAVMNQWFLIFTFCVFFVPKGIEKAVLFDVRGGAGGCSPKFLYKISRDCMVSWKKEKLFRRVHLNCCLNGDLNRIN